VFVLFKVKHKCNKIIGSLFLAFGIISSAKKDKNSVLPNRFTHRIFSKSAARRVSRLEGASSASSTVDNIFEKNEAVAGTVAGMGLAAISSQTTISTFNIINFVL
jgi:hypothetical protein